MCLILMLFKLLLGLEDICAVLASVPVLTLLVLQTQLSSVRRPTSVASSALDLVCVHRAEVQMISHAIGIEVAAAAFRHD